MLVSVWLGAATVAFSRPPDASNKMDSCCISPRCTRTALLSRAEYQLRRLRGGASPTDVGGEETLPDTYQLGGNSTAEGEDQLVELPSLMVGGTEYLYDEDGEYFGVKHVLFTMDGEPWGVYDPVTRSAEEAEFVDEDDGEDDPALPAPAPLILDLQPSRSDPLPDSESDEVGTTAGLEAVAEDESED